ncbi:TolC family protein [Flaviaesturariibacter amylovorans]|uniref:Multidrug efflux RND transporter outer membrane channel subunit OprM n=1 Tax=Flaviaesturariibacter amylovorans TaxID=1084520 RepID=A0ABP8GJT2_9BACT
MTHKQANRSRTNRRSLWTLLGLTLLGTAATAQAPVTPPSPLALKDAVNYALKANAEARKARLDIENAEYRIDEVRASALPQVSGSAGLTYNPLLQKSALPNFFGGNPNETILVAFGQKWNAVAGLSVQQNLFNKSVFTGLKAARTSREFYQLNAQLTEEQIIEQVATTYYQVLVQRQQVSVVDSSIANTQRVQGVLASLYKNGLAKKIDVDRIEVTITNLQSQRQQVINGVALLEHQLKLYMGLPIATPVTIPDVNPESIVPQAVPATDSIDLQKRTEFLVLQKQGELLEQQKENYRNEYFPSLSLGGNYNYMGMGNAFPVFKGQSAGANWFGTASVSLNLRVPIFNGGATKARIKQADVSIRKLNEDIANTGLQLNLAYENARTQINNNIITLNNQRRNVGLAEEVFRNTQNNYNNGLATLTDLLDAERSLTEARSNLSAALLNYRVSEVQLVKARGGIRTLTQ